MKTIVVENFFSNTDVKKAAILRKDESITVIFQEILWNLSEHLWVYTSEKLILKNSYASFFCSCFFDFSLSEICRNCSSDSGIELYLFLNFDNNGFLGKSFSLPL